MNGDLEIVVDGRPDRSLDLLTDAPPSETFNSQLVVLNRNFGSFSIITAGVAAAPGGGEHSTSERGDRPTLGPCIEGSSQKKKAKWIENSNTIPVA
jgi:hypothetical protein